MAKVINVFVEGDDEERFVQTLWRSCNLASRISLQVIQYAHGKARKRALSAIGVLRSLGASYLVLGDLDECSCVKSRKQCLAESLAADSGFVAIVCPEIEGWYIAGVSADKRKALGIERDIQLQAEQCTKEKFNRLIPKRFRNRTPFMLELLKRYDCDTACASSPSLRYAKEKLEKITAQ